MAQTSAVQEQRSFRAQGRRRGVKSCKIVFLFTFAVGCII